MSHWGDAAKSKAAELLPRINATKVMRDLQAHGCALALSADGVGITVSGEPLTPELRQKLKDHKPAILELLSGVKPEPAAESWDADAAKVLIQQVFEAIDRLAEQRDMAKFRRVAQAMIDMVPPAPPEKKYETPFDSQQDPVPF